MAEANQLLVEGRDDRMVVESLLRHHGLKFPLKIVPFEGITPLLTALPVVLKGSNLQRLGVVVDADMSLESRWGKLRRVHPTNVAVMRPCAGGRRVRGRGEG